MDNNANGALRSASSFDVAVLIRSIKAGLPGVYAAGWNKLCIRSPRSDTSALRRQGASRTRTRCS
jgi:hypothetical protein